VAAVTADTKSVTTTDYVIDIALLAIVALQVRGRRLTVSSLLLPIGIVVFAAFEYLHGIPTAGNDLALVIAGAAAGITLGILTGLFTTVRTGADGLAFAKAGALAAILWTIGVGTRLAFQLYASHGGGPAIARFSAHHTITSTEAWVAALILMALSEVVGRTAVLAVRAWSVAPMSLSRARHDGVW
jgi:hypothetical protein